MRAVLVELVPRVRLRSRSATCFPVTSTLALILSPGRTFILIVLAFAGTSSDQAE
jgi:hypothetical protein